jgi:hypothetical protein
MYFIINQNLPHYGAKSLEIDDFQLWVARRSGVTECALRVGANRLGIAFYDLYIISEGFSDRLRWINHNICSGKML